MMEDTVRSMMETVVSGKVYEVFLYIAVPSAMFGFAACLYLVRLIRK